MGHKITILGSINMDFITTCERAAKAGETVLGTSFKKSVGGKGANLAHALARLGEHPVLLGELGDDTLADELLEGLKGVDTSCIERTHSQSGLAQITLEHNANNRIIVIPGANAKLDASYVKKYENVIKSSCILMSLLEIPQSAILQGFKLAFKAKVPTLLNFAPALKLSCPLLEYTNILVLNESELLALCDKGINPKDYEDLCTFANEFLARYENLKVIIITLGEKGAFYADNTRKISIPAYPAREVVDTTGAGDCFIASFIMALLQEYKSSGKRIREDIQSASLSFKQLKKALEFAACAASFSVGREGASPSYPSMEELLSFSKDEVALSK